MSDVEKLSKMIRELHNKQIEEIRELESERESALEKEQYDKMTRTVYQLYDSYIRAGFDHKQAWKLVIITVKNSK